MEIDTSNLTDEQISKLSEFVHIMEKENKATKWWIMPKYSALDNIADFEDIANAVWYFASELSKNTTGAELVVDGGMLAQLTPNIERELWWK